MDYRDRYKWNKNSFISDSAYLRMYIDTLKQFFSLQERQTIYVISKYFTDGVEYARKNLEVANACFEAGERLVSRLDSGLPPLLFDFIANIYNRSKSYYFHKAGDHQRATRLVAAAIETNERLIASGHFDMLLFDSISHYHNYTALLRRNNQAEKAGSILGMLSAFLLTARPNAIFSSDKAAAIMKDTAFYSLKYSNIHTVILMSLLKEVEQRRFTGHSDGMQGPVTDAVRSCVADMVVQTDDDDRLKRWFACYSNISSGSMPAREYSSEAFDQFLKNTPNMIMGLLAEKIGASGQLTANLHHL
ncbi:hypothetical protein [Chitinophaga sp. XS-30]|uniref:hypothetical protein n=1 Tax=Chitinophaga sp. XS-30 TaxID=2604421 RepID=UPI0011DDC442|nr:hypothetical protein [Chitinophaga sp. XS-30]QEH42010.1 hypothetical protein FW415_14460 [Chitinophaga sp. XS-30]